VEMPVDSDGLIISHCHQMRAARVMSVMRVNVIFMVDARLRVACTPRKTILALGGGRTPLPEAL
jgi:hypothetical protein